MGIGTTVNQVIVKLKDCRRQSGRRIKRRIEEATKVETIEPKVGYYKWYRV